jgi:hypothetical protein
MNRIQIDIAGTVLSATGGPGCPPLNISSSHMPFQVSERIPDIDLNIHVGDLPQVSWGEKIFDSRSTWRLYRHHDQYLIPIVSPASGPLPYRLLRVNDRFDAGEVNIRRGALRQLASSLSADFSVDPFEYPLDELFMVNFLARNRQGVHLHACGVQDNGRGLVFCGVSGAGKSTLAELWRPTGVNILSDERLIVRRRAAGDFCLHGTPWTGDAGIGLPAAAPLEKLFIIQHAPCNYIKPLARMEAATQLLVRCFPPFYDREAMGFVTELLDRIATEVPCFELGFLPDASAVDFIRGLT